MAEAVALTMVGWFVKPAIDLVNKSMSYLGTDTAKELEDLETTLLPQIQLTIQAAQHNPPDDKAQGALAKWLARLKNAYFDVEAILHDVEYERLEHKAKGLDETHLSLKPRLKFVLKKNSLLQQMKELKKIAAEANTFRDLLAIQNTGNIHNASNSSRSVTSSLLADKVFGRDGDRDEIINFLLDNQGCSSLRKSYSIVAVTGLGGAGKTTLAQYVYNEPRVKQYFPMKMWLCLSQKLDITKHTKEMIECASKKECPNLNNFDFLKNKLLDSLPESNSILVVLDDVWYDHNDGPEGEKQWENFLKPLAFRGGTCKIVITSCSTLFPIALRPKKLVQLHDLTHNDFISLLRYHTIDDLQINNPQLRNDLSHIVDQIAKKMSISPLAATVVGNQLRERPDIRLWQVTLENVNLSDTMMKSLPWSFHRLDVQLQRCFLFCSIFPKGTRYDLDIMVPYWVALDFIQPSNDNTSVEDIGLEYFEKMVANSIFHKVDKNKYIMHDLFHDLAEKLSAEDCFRVTNAEREIPLTVQHVYLEAFNNEDLKKNLSSICKLGNLRTLILVNPFYIDISEIISKISTNFKNLRVLDVRSRGYKILPRVVGDFRNLRLLSFWQSSIKQLPNSVSQLYHLQYLRLPSVIFVKKCRAEEKFVSNFSILFCFLL